MGSARAAFLAALFLFLSFFSFAGAKSLERLAGGVLMVGFTGTEAPKESAICRQIRRYGPAGVILFDRPIGKKRGAKNIAGPEQLRRLTRQLRACAPGGRLLIAVDQEGGLVQRLRRSRGFATDFPRASRVAAKGEAAARSIYERMAKELQRSGINYDLAPVVDLALNPENRVIVGFGRSYGKDPESVARYAGIFVDAMHRYGVATSLKHFPGHGSSTGDTHAGFVDVSGQWKPKELEPYRRLIREGKADSVMVAHLFDRRWDPRYPASLSPRVVRGMLRKKLGYNGVAITDDLQMGAIAKRYSLPETLRLALNAGNDILLFGNQLDPRRTVSLERLAREIVKLVKEGRVSRERLEEANRRVERLQKRFP
jgi:beta-N-acetylhexosaminidase